MNVPDKRCKHVFCDVLELTSLHSPPRDPAIAEMMSCGSTARKTTIGASGCSSRRCVAFSISMTFSLGQRSRSSTMTAKASVRSSPSSFTLPSAECRIASCLRALISLLWWSITPKRVYKLRANAVHQELFAKSFYRANAPCNCQIIEPCETSTLSRALCESRSSCSHPYIKYICL